MLALLSTAPGRSGNEIAGVIAAIGADVEGWSVGGRVISTLGHGGLAEKAARGAIDKLVVTID